MSTLERKPSQAVVEIPQPVDSDSGRPVTVEGEKRKEVRRHRYSTVRVLVLGGVIGVAGTIGYDGYNAYTDHKRDQVSATIAEKEKQPQPISLQHAQVMASLKLFGASGDSVDVAAAQEVVHTPCSSENLSVEGYLPKQVEISEDGKTFKAEGQDYGINRIISEDGSVYVVASQSVVEENLFTENKTYAANPILVGGAHNDASSDRNSDGMVTPEEIRETADENARYNLGKVR